MALLTSACQSENGASSAASGGASGGASTTLLTPTTVVTGGATATNDPTSTGGHSSRSATGGNATLGTSGAAATVAGGSDVGTGGASIPAGGSGSTTGSGGNSGNATTAGAGSSALAPVCGTFPTKPTVTGTLFTAGLEASGIVASRKQPGVYWMHGDSSPLLIAIDNTGKQLGQWEVTSSARFFFIYNWEDIAIQSTKVGADRIWVGDIGNHTEDASGNPVEPRANLRLMSIDEPTVDPMQVINGTVKVIEDLTFEYPDGLFDSEALMIDPANNDVYVVSKTAAAPSKIYRIQAPIANGKLEYIGTLDADSINGGDISPSGRELVLRNYTYLYYWALPSGKTWSEVLALEPTLPSKKTRITFTQNYFAEAICFTLDETGLYAVSEEQPGSGVGPSPVEFYPKSCK